MIRVMGDNKGPGSVRPATKRCNQKKGLRGFPRSPLNSFYLASSLAYASLVTEGETARRRLREVLVVVRVVQRVL